MKSALFSRRPAISLTLLAFLAVRPSGAQRAGGTLLVVNQGDHNVTFLPATGVPSTLDVGGVTGHEIALTPDGKTAFVPVYGNSGVGKPGTDGQTMTVLSVPDHKVIGTVDFGHPVRPHCAVYDRKRNLLYVTTELDQAVTIIDPHTLKIVGKISTGQQQSHMLAISHDGRFGYTANVAPGTVSVMDLNSRKTIAIIPVASPTQRISISNDDRRVFTADQTKARLAVINTSTNKLDSWITLPDVAYGTAPTPDGHWLLAAMRASNQVAVIDLQTLKVLHTIDVPKTPTEILMRPDGKAAYVSCGGKVAVIDTAAWKVQSVLQAGTGADGLAWAQ